MTRRLVELDAESYTFKEIDLVKMRRTAAEFKQWLSQIDPADDPFEFLKIDLPIVELALKDMLVLPYKGFPHTWEFRDGIITDEYLEACAPFYHTIRGSHQVPPEIIYDKGKMFAWKHFEEEGSPKSSDAND